MHFTPNTYGNSPRKMRILTGLVRYPMHLYYRYRNFNSGKART